MSKTSAANQSETRTEIQTLSEALGTAPMSQGKFKIRVNSLIPDRPTTFDTYIMINGRTVLYLRAGDSLSASKIAHLQKADVFYVPDEQRAF
ncbi:MAG: hypothetical protein RBT63_07080, partial [Bdellovibrionales bacterium]|nr:hypothetical protein [Bdellovibrionales bacterium]